MFKSQYEETDGSANKESWNQYWARMTTDRTWIDYWLVQATSWYLQLDIWIIATSSTETNPYIEVSGNLADGSKPSGGPVITLGTKSNVHYQSLLPIEMFHMEFQQNQHHPNNEVKQSVEQFKSSKTRKEIQEKYNKQESAEDLALKKTKGIAINAKDEVYSIMIPEPFVYEKDGKLLVFPCKSEDYIMKCQNWRQGTLYNIY